MPDRPVVGGVEQRNAPAPISVEGRKLRGLIPYEVESRDLGGWRERMAPGSLTGAKMDDLIATVDHAGVPLGRFPGTLEVEDSAEGLRWSVELPESRSDVREAVERGDLKAGSWRMIVGRDSWDGSLRTVEEVRELRDVAVVTLPAYPGAACELRAAPAPDVKEDEVPENPAPTTGGLRVEDRAHEEPTRPVEARVIDAMAGVPKGEMRDLVHATTEPVQPDDVQKFVWDRLRQTSVLLQTGIPVFDTDRRALTWPVITGDLSAEFYNELEEIVPSDMTLDDFEIEPKAIKALVRGSSEAFEDSDPDLLSIVAANMTTVLGLRLDREGIVGNHAKGFKGLATMTGTQTLPVGGALTNYDAILKAVGLLAEAFVPGPYAVLAHPRVLLGLGLLKTEDGSNEALARPADIPPIYSTPHLTIGAGPGYSTTVIVYAPGQLAVGRRRDTTIEIDRSQEFSSDAVLVRGKVRAALGTPHPEAVVKLTGVTAAPIA